MKYIIQSNVIRATSMRGPVQWCKGDFSKVFIDGTEIDATYDEYSEFLGIPKIPNVMITPTADN